jgi:heat shock transcription factor
VLDEDEFAKTLIPELFKHNNYASFVRQLNMYGFHKRVGLSDNSMKASERKNKSPSEYYNPYFKRGHPNLLWLINKPKSGSKATPGSKRPKTEEKQDGSDDDGQDIEETFYNNQASRALSAAPEAGPLQRREIANIHNEISEIKKNQGIIMNSIGRIRKDHAHLLNQALTFQGLHDRHESSINAILTFLATVYNRSLDGQNPVNLGQMFANGITPQDQQQNQGNVVDLGELAGQQQQQAQQPAGNISPNRRNQLLLMAPPNAANRGQTASPSASTPQAGYGNTTMSGSVEELFDSNSPADSTQIKAEQDQATMMNLINNTNAQVGNNSNGMEFPEMLSHYENANGNSPLTPDQRSTMLNMMASQASAPGTNNALVSPSPDTPDMVQTLAELGYTGREIDDIARLSGENGHKITKLHNAYVTPLSPSGSIPGLNDAAYFNGAEPADPNLDLDQYLESGAFYNGSSPLGGYAGGEGGYDPYNDLGASTNGDIDLFADGVHDGSRIVETAGSSEVGTPEAQREDVNVTVNGVVGGSDGGLKSPSKKRRRN